MGLLQRLDALTAPIPPAPAPIPAPTVPDPILLFQKQIAYLARLVQRQHVGMQDMMGLLRQIAANTAYRQPYDESFVITAEQKPVLTQGYKHVMLWVPVASQQFIIEPPTSQPTTLTLAQGWNILDCPDRTLLYTATLVGNGIICGLHLTDTEPQGAIV